MNYVETVEWLYTQLPVYQRTGGANYKIDLSKTERLMELLNHPEMGFDSIHIGGTNGKGSTSHMIASIFQEAGYKVGLYTSPHLRDFRERIKINGEMISQDEVIEFVHRYKEKFVELQLSFFEMTVGLAFDYFTKSKVDIAIIEVGMGGEFDSTNVITPLVSVLTNVGLDHMDFLGDTIEKIARTKSGIIKPNVPVVVSETHPESAPIFMEKARSTGSDLHFADREMQEVFVTDLRGNYQVHNVKAAVLAVKLQQKFNISEEIIRRGLLHTVANTGLLGRWQTLGNNPLIIADTGHNPHGMQYIVEQIAQQTYDQLHMVIGMVNDKDVSKVLGMLPKNARYYFCKPNIPRGRDAELLSREAANFGLVGTSYPSVETALAAAKSAASEGDMIFVGGSTFVVAEVV